MQKRKITSKPKVRKVAAKKIARKKIGTVRKAAKKVARRTPAKVVARKPTFVSEAPAAPVAVVEVIETEVYSEELPAEVVLEGEPE